MIFFECCQDFVCFRIEESGWHDVDQPFTSSLLFCFAMQYLMSDCMSTISMKCCGLHACSTCLVLSFSTSTEVAFSFPFFDGPTCLVQDRPLTSLPPVSLSVDQQQSECKYIITIIYSRGLPSFTPLMFPSTCISTALSFPFFFAGTTDGAQDRDWPLTTGLATWSLPATY